MNKPMTTKEMEKWVKEAWEKAQRIPEIQTEAEKIAYCKGWWDALEAQRTNARLQRLKGG